MAGREIEQLSQSIRRGEVDWEKLVLEVDVIFLWPRVLHHYVYAEASMQRDPEYPLTPPLRK